jgi:hypothetical protein
MKPVVFGLLIFGVAIGVVLVFTQAPFTASVFEYQQYRDYKGVLIDWPYPMLISGADRFLLVDPGKHGASTNGLAGKTVELKGALIHRGTDRMLELLPSSLRAIADSGASETRLELGEMALTGEIVDGKCYLGVMNPGNGKVHRDCAARCISGGIPPAFVVRDASGESHTLLLVGDDGRKLHREILDYVAEPVRISGRLSRVGSTLVFSADLRSLHRE